MRVKSTGRKKEEALGAPLLSGVLIMIQTIRYFVLPDGFYCPKHSCVFNKKLA